MTQKFDNSTFEIYKTLRKPLPKPVQKIESKKDKAYKQELKKGRKTWKEQD